MLYAQFNIAPTPISGKIDLTNQSSIPVTLVNSSNSIQVMSLSLGSLTDNTNGFSIVVDRCSGKSLPPKQSCYALINFNKNQLASSQIREVFLKNGSSNLTILSGTNNISLSPANFSASVSSLNFGSIVDFSRSTSPKSIVITNNGQQKGTPIIEIPAGLSIALNRCSNGVESGKSCVVSFTFKSNPLILPQIGSNYSGNILIKKNIGDSSPISVAISVLLNNTCSVGFEYSTLLNSCIDVKPILTTLVAGFSNATAFPGNSTPSNQGIFTSTMNAGFDILLSKKDPKGGNLSYVIEAGSSLSSLTVLTNSPQTGLPVSYPSSESVYFSYPNVSLFQNGVAFRLFKAYDPSPGIKQWFIKITATSSISGLSNSVVISPTYQNDLKFLLGQVSISANNSQITKKEITSSINGNISGSVISGYRDIAYINPSNNSLVFKINASSSTLNSESMSSYKISYLISEANLANANALFNTKVYAFYEYDANLNSFYRKDTLNDTQSFTCSRNSSTGEVICAINSPTLANDLAGKVLQVRVRPYYSENTIGRSFFHNFLVVNNISGTACNQPADPVASPFHGIKVVDLNNDGIIQHTDVYMQICSAQELRSISYTSLSSPIGLARRFANYSLEQNIDMAPYYAGGGYRFSIREIQSIFKGNNFKISNFNVDVNNNTKNNANVTTNESTIGPNYPVGNGGYNGTGAQSQLGFINRIIGANISDLTLENITVLGNGWTSVGSFGLVYGFGSMSSNGRVDLGTQTTGNSNSITYNLIKNVKIISSGVDGQNRYLSRIKGSSNIGGLAGNITGDQDVNTIITVPYTLENVKINNISLDTDNFFTQGAITVGGITGTGRGALINKVGVTNMDLKDASGTTTGLFVGGIVGYDHYSTMNDVFLANLVGQASSNSQIGGIIGVEEAFQNFSTSTYYHSFGKSASINRGYAALDFDTSTWSFADNSIAINFGRFVSGFNNISVSNSFVAGNISNSFSTPTNNYYLNGFASFTDVLTPTNISNVEYESAPSVSQCVGISACSNLIAVNPLTYTVGYFFNQSLGSPSIQSWDFSNVWRYPTGLEYPEFPQLR